jgi:hypothetical protein
MYYILSAISLWLFSMWLSGLWLRVIFPPGVAILRNELDCSRCNKLLQRPASRKPSAPPKGIFPRYPERLGVNNLIRHLDIRQVYVALVCTLIPTEHRIDSRAELIASRLIDTACIMFYIEYLIVCTHIFFSTT